MARGNRFIVSAASAGGVRSFNGQPVRAASLFLLGQPRFGKLVNHMRLCSLFCRVSLRLRRGVWFRVICCCCAHGFFSFNVTQGLCHAPWLSAVLAMDFRSSCDRAAGRAHGLRPVASHLQSRQFHPVNTEQSDHRDKGNKNDETDCACVHGNHTFPMASGSRTRPRRPKTHKARKKRALSSC